MNKIVNCIITPTFTGHFKYVGKYLKSFKNFAEDKDDFCIYFTINSNEYLDFEKIIKKYKLDLNIKVLIFEDILDQFKITENPDELLKKYGKFSFQTLKKLYSMLYIGENHKFLVLDSESMLIKKTNIGKLFYDYFKNPDIIYSNVTNSKNNDNFVSEEINNIDIILNCGKNKWFLETFKWFYDYNILKDIYEDYGEFISMIRKVYQNQSTKTNTCECGIFEILLYYNYIDINNNKYNYRIINIDNEIKKYLSEKNIEDYIEKILKSPFKNTGVIENTMLFLNKNNYKEFAKLFKDNNFNIIRCENSNKNYKYQKKFVSILKPNIFACSQEHIFGINSSFINLFIVKTGLKKPILHLNKHLRQIINIKYTNIKRLCFEFLSIIFYLIKIIFLFLFNFWKVF